MFGTAEQPITVAATTSKTPTDLPTFIVQGGLYTFVLRTIRMTAGIDTITRRDGTVKISRDKAMPVPERDTRMPMKASDAQAAATTRATMPAGSPTIDGGFWNIVARASPANSRVSKSMTNGELASA